MKYRLVRNDLEPSFPGKPFGWVPDDMKDFVETRQVFSSGELKDVMFWRTDVVFDHPSGAMLVRNGDAEPMDEKCEKACRLTPEQMAEVQRKRERLARGINPEDFEAYDKGYMVGYAADGSGKWEPGPNYAEWKAKQTASILTDDEDDDDIKSDRQNPQAPQVAG